MSSSALRYAENLTNVLRNTDKGKIIGADCFGPMEIMDNNMVTFGTAFI